MTMEYIYIYVFNRINICGISHHSTSHLSPSDLGCSPSFAPISSICWAHSPASSQKSQGTPGTHTATRQVSGPGSWFKPWHLTIFKTYMFLPSWLFFYKFKISMIKICKEQTWVKCHVGDHPADFLKVLLESKTVQQVCHSSAWPKNLCLSG